MYIRLIKASKDGWEIIKHNDGDKSYFLISTPDGEFYKDYEGKEYHFKTRQDALEELAYLRGEHDGDENEIKASKDGWEVMPNPLGWGYVIATPDGGYLADEDDKDELMTFSTRDRAKYELEYYKDQYDSGIKLKTL